VEKEVIVLFLSNKRFELFLKNILQYAFQLRRGWNEG